jgi:hypothetical protein
VREHFGVPCPEVQLCVSELLTNVIKHLGEGTPVTLRVTRTDGRTRVAVTDPEPYAWLVVRAAGPDDENGRGLLLLDALATPWGVGQGPEGKTVRCELDSLADDRGGQQATAGGESLLGLAGGEVGVQPDRGDDDRGVLEHA